MKHQYSNSILCSKLIAMDQSQFLIVKDDVCFKPIALNEIIFCESDNSYCTFHLLEKKPTTTCNFSLKKCEGLLNIEKGFFRIHNKYLVNLVMIECFRPGTDGGVVIMKNKVELKVARSRKKELKNALYKISVNAE